MTEFFLIDADQLKKLRAVATCLHSEDRLNGDQMRDLGHTLAGIADTCEQIPVPEEVRT